MIGDDLRVLHIVGARPNFMKVAPVLNALKACKHVVQTLVHTGQHYDANMSDVFFEQLGIPAPDVNPTVATTLVCAKLGVRVGHVEAGLRSFDRTMPEEINRLVTDQLADLLFTPSEDGDQNLAKEGIPASKVYRVGNVMIDSLVRLLPVAMEKKVSGLPDRYILVTLHRPANVDDDRTLKMILGYLLELNRQVKVVFPVHPRTRKRIADFGIDVSRLNLLESLPYIEFLSLQRHATAVVTDSGGIQE